MRRPGCPGARLASSALALAVLLALAGSAAAPAEVVQRGDLRVNFEGRLTPHVLPRRTAAPVEVALGGTIATTDGSAPPQLRRIVIEINRNGRLDRSGLPVCRIGQIQPASNAKALEACGGAKVGEGHFSAEILLPAQTPFPSVGRVLVFNGVFQGRPALLAHVYGTEPAPTSYTLPFLILASRRGTFGTRLSASLAEVTSEWGYVTAISMTLGRTFRFGGRRHAYLSADCPAPEGFPGATFPLARASFGFEGRTLGTTLTRSCKARG